MPVVIPGSTADYLSRVDGTGGVALHRRPTKRRKVTLAAQVLHFDGLTYPRVYFGESEDDVWDVAYPVTNADGAAFAALLTLIEERTVLLWRDVHGNVVYVAVTEIEDAPTLPLPAPNTVEDVRFTLTRVTYP